jgi:hypothetical protein
MTMIRHLTPTIALAALLLGTTAALAAAPEGSAGNQQSTPKGWNYQIVNGQRVPKANNRVTNPDGSWREEVRQGKCTTIKEKSAAGEYKESRSCN